MDIPDGVHATVTRDYGQTANDKADELMLHLALAALAVVLLVLFALGWREAIVVGTAVVMTLAITLFASWAIGFTINRVSLFALIFSIGILVDDAIVVVENIHRHMARGDKRLLEAIPAAVDEVGGPTILATFTVIAALLPMAFVGGLMGPYMRPIPINASVGMLISLAVAFIVTPWLAYRLLRHQVHQPVGEVSPARVAEESKIDRLPAAAVHPRDDAVPRAPRRPRRNRRRLFLGMGMLVLLAAGLAGVKLVILKMLPFDNKSEFQVVLNMPEGSTLEQTHRALVDMSQVLNAVPEVKNYQLYAGTSAPMNFNGLVRQYYPAQPALSGRHPGQPGRQGRTQATEPRDRDGRASGAGRRGTALPCASGGGRGAARAAGDGTDRGRDLRAGLQDSARGGAVAGEAVRQDAGHRRRQPQCRKPAGDPSADRDRPRPRGGPGHEPGRDRRCPARGRGRRSGELCRRRKCQSTRCR